MKIDLITQWNTQCGIASYAEFLKRDLEKLDCKVNAHSVKEPLTSNIVHIQFVPDNFKDLKVFSKHLSAYSAIPFYLKLWLTRKKIITTFHETPPRTEKKLIQKIYSRLLYGVICRCSSAIIVHTKAAQTRFGHKKKSYVIPIGCPQIIHANTTACKKQLGLENKQVILAAGFISNHKGFDLAIKALPMLPTDTVLLIAGSLRTTEDEATFEQLKKDAAEKNVHFIIEYPISNVCYGAADVAVLPYTSASESMMLRILASWGIPTLTSDMPVFRELQKEWEAIEIFSSGDTTDFAAKLNSMLADFKLRELLTQKATIMAKQSNWNTIAENHLAIYKKVIT